MAIKVNFNGVSILKPGAYSILNTTLLTDAPLGESGIVGIIGEASGGEPGVLDILSRPQIQSAKLRYKGGPIAKALELLANPSNDPRIPNGASSIVVYKTNNSTQSTKSLNNNQSSPSAILNLTSENYGTDENNINILISAGDVEDSNASVQGTIAGSYTLAGADTLVINHGGTAYTFTSTLGAGSFTAQQVADEMNVGGNWAPSKPVTAEKVTVGSSDFVKVTLDDLSDAAKLEYGVMNVDATSSLDTVLGMSNTAVRGVKGDRVVTINKGETTDVSGSLGGIALLSVQYTGAGSAAVLDVQVVSGVKTLSTSVTGGPGGENLSIDISEITLQELADQINANSAYSASTSYFNAIGEVAGDSLDFYNDIDIKTISASLYGTASAVNDHINDNSDLISSELVDDIVGQVDILSSAEFFSGGTLGSSSNSNFQSGFDAFKSLRINTVVPLISKDGISPSTYTIDSVNAQADAHCAFMSSTLGKSERNCYVSKNGDKDTVKSAARAINSRHTSLVSQQPTVLNENGDLEEMEEWAFACLCAGMQAGSEVGEPITYKVIRAFALDQDSSWDPRIDFDEMIEAGVLFAEQTDAGTFRVVVGNTTYSQDSNLVFNRISINEAANYVAFELRTHLENLFTGTKARTGSATAIKNAAADRLEQLRSEDIIVDGNEDDGSVIPAYRDLQVEISGVTASVKVTITPVPGIDFVLSDIFLTSLQASASA